MNTNNSSELREVTGDEMTSVEGGGRFSIQDLMARYAQNEVLATNSTQTTLVHEPTHQ